MVGVQLIVDKRKDDSRSVDFCLFQGISFVLPHVTQAGLEFPMQLRVIDRELLILLPYIMRLQA